VSDEPNSSENPSTSTPEEKPPSWADIGIGVLNGVIGDYLQARNNDLAQQLAVYRDNKPIAVDADSLAKTFHNATPRVCVFAHGLCCTESSWRFAGDTERTYGHSLREDLGITSVFIRYNTGLHISENGRAYCQLLDSLINHWPTEVEDLTLVGHSMGGLISRSACLYADRLGARWIDKLHRAIYLGSPHFGAPLEKFGNVAAAVFGIIPDPVTRLARDLINVRSIGIKDLRYANLVDEDWIGQHPDAVLVNSRTDAPLRDGVHHYVVAGTLTKAENHVLAKMIGDALVRVPSATGRPEGGKGGFGLPHDHVARFPGLHHMKLARDADVYARIKTWFVD
jgi:pimeloyl-ACP methyl ester carboxylesterase